MMLKSPLSPERAIGGQSALPGEPDGANESDEQLVERVRLGDVSPFALLIQRHNRSMYRIVRSIVKDPQEAEDVVQQTHLSAYLNLHQFEGRAKFSTWLARIATHEALARLRTRHRGETFTVEDVDRLVSADPPPQTPEEETSRRELAKTVEVAIDELPHAYRVAFVLRHVEGLDTQEAAAWLGVTEENLRVRLHRARFLLRDRILELVQATAEEVFSFGGPRCARVTQHVLFAVHAHLRSGIVPVAALPRPGAGQ